MQTPFMPFKILAVAPFQITGEILENPLPVPVNRASLDDAMAGMNVRLRIPIPSELCPAGVLDFQFTKLKDFHPDGLVQTNPFLSHLMEAGQFLSEAQTKKLSEPELRERMKQWPDLPEIRLSFENPASGEKTSQTASSDALDNILNMVAMPGASSADSSLSPSGTTQIDAILEKVLTHIFEDKGFRAAESAWRGLSLLLHQAASEADDVAFEIVTATINSLDGLLTGLTVGLIDRLPSLIIIDLPFDNSPFCTGLLEKIVTFSETLMIPAMVQASSRFMHLDSWNDMQRLSFIPHHLQQPMFAKWQALKKQDAANWLAVTCNRFLVRYPYGPDNSPRKSDFKETQLPWAGTVWAVAGLMVQSHLKTGWPTRFTQWKNFKIENLALHPGDAFGVIPTETLFDENRLDQMARAGIMALAAAKNKDTVFLSHDTAVTGISFAYQLFLSRITQLVLWCKDNLPDELSGEVLEKSVKTAFARFWEKNGRLLPENFQITVGRSDADNRIPMRIDFHPSRDILPRGEHVVMDFFW